MASKSVYQEFDPTALQHFGLESTPEYGVLTSSGVETVKLTDSVDTYNKLKDIILKETLDATTFKAKKKGFLLPGSPVSIDRVKAACKEHNITITNDYETADFIITHAGFYDSFSNGETIKTTMMMAKIWNYEAYDSSVNRIPEVENYVSTTKNLVLYDTKWEKYVNSYNMNQMENVYDSWMLTGLLLNIAYKLEIGELGSINVDIVVHESASKQVLTEQIIKDLSMQIQSYNDEDTNIAAMMIPTIDYTKKLHLLWQFAQVVYSSMYKFNRNKDVQYWMDACDFQKLYNCSAQDMIQRLEKEDKLDSESFRYLEPIVRREIRIHNRDLYVFKVEVKPEYRKYLKKIERHG